MKEQSNQHNLLHSEDFDFLYHNAANKALAHAPRRIDAYKKDEKADIRSYTKGNLSLVIKDGGKPLSHIGHMLLDYAMLELSKNNEIRTPKTKTLPETCVLLDFDKVAKDFGREEKQAKYRLKKQTIIELERLFQLDVYWQNEEKRDVYRGRIISGYKPFENDQRSIFINFTQEFVVYSMRYIMQLNRKLFQIGERYTNDYLIGRKLYEQYFAAQMRKLRTHDRLAVKTLLEAAPDIPSLFEVQKNHKRRYKQLIIDPLDESLERLVKQDIISEYTWWLKGNVPLSKDQLDNMKTDIFDELYIHFQISEPEM